MLLDHNPSPPLGNRFAIPAKLHVFISFMLQFTVAILLLGILPAELQSGGIKAALSWVVAAVTTIVLYIIIGLLGRLLPVDCKNCSGVARYRGLGWWPYTYWYDCRECGTSRRIDVRGH